MVNGGVRLLCRARVTTSDCTTWDSEHTDFFVRSKLVSTGFHLVFERTLYWLAAVSRINQGFVPYQGDTRARLFYNDSSWLCKVCASGQSPASRAGRSTPLHRLENALNGALHP